MNLLLLCLLSLVMLAAVAGIGVATVRALGGGGNQRVKALEAQVAELRQELDNRPALPAGPSSTPAWPVKVPGAEPMTFGSHLVPVDLVQETAVLLRHGQKIRAVKVARERLGLDLGEAKRLVEEIERRGA